MITTWNDLDLQHYLSLKDIDTEALDELGVQVAMIAVLSDLTEDEVLNLPLQDYRLCVSQLGFLLSEPPQPKPSKTVTVVGRTLTVLLNPTGFTTGQYIDFSNYLKDGEKNLPLLLTTLLVPQGERYGQTPVEEMEELVLKLPIPFVLGLTRFFFRRTRSLTIAMLTSLVWTLKRMARKEKETEKKERLLTAVKETNTLLSSVRSGDGLLPWMMSPTLLGSLGMWSSISPS